MFVHISALERSGLTALNEGERVTFDVIDGRKGIVLDRIYHRWIHDYRHGRNW